MTEEASKEALSDLVERKAREALGMGQPYVAIELLQMYLLLRSQGF